MRPLTGLETYVALRVTNGALGGGLLDLLPLHVAITACELFGDVVFGKPVERRVLHSIRTLSKETGLHPKRLRKLLQAAGMLPEGSDDLVDGNCLFDAQRGSHVASEASTATLSVGHHPAGR